MFMFLMLYYFGPVAFNLQNNQKPGCYERILWPFMVNKQTNK